MPKRVIDGEALWLSEKVRSLPLEYRLHYAHWLPLAEANGVFEADPVRVQARIYSYLMPNMDVRATDRILKALIKANLVRVWDEDGKTWGYFIGIEKSGRLPSMSQLPKYKNLPPNPPLEEVV